MPASAKNREFARNVSQRCAAAILALFISACESPEAGFGIQLGDVRLESGAGRIVIHARQDIDLSDEAREALRGGVPLRFRVDAILRDKGQLRDAASSRVDFELRYLPLSERYQLATPGGDPAVTSYPRLRHALAAMRDLEVSLADPQSDPGPAPDTRVIRLRSRLDHSAMPGPMQLPALLSRQWDHDSGWVTTELERNG